VRGGSWGNSEVNLRASVRNNADPTVERVNIGFRVATVPEPTVAVSLMLGLVVIVSRRKRPF